MTKVEKKNYLEKIDKTLDRIRPHLAIDGGNIKLIDISDDMIVSFEWLGNCENCTMSDLTMKAGIENTLLISMPEIKGIIAIN